jgi:hypothetical protein
MNTIAKVLAPAALVFASFSASAAGLIETDYPLHQPASVQAAASNPATASGPVFTGLDIHYPGPGVTASSGQSASRQDSMREVSGTGLTLPFGPGLNA